VAIEQLAAGFRIAGAPNIEKLVVAAHAGRGVPSRGAENRPRSPQVALGGMV
jgi:hypothetical protein